MLLMEQVLEHFGWQADLCNNGLEAIALVKQHKSRYAVVRTILSPAILRSHFCFVLQVLLDVHMPVLDGTQALNEVRGLEQHAEEVTELQTSCLLILAVSHRRVGLWWR